MMIQDISIYYKYNRTIIFGHDRSQQRIFTIGNRFEFVERRVFLTIAAVGFVVPTAGCLDQDVDIRVTQIDVEPATLAVGETADVSVRVGNWGDDDGTRTVTLHIEDEKWNDEDVTVTGSIDDDVPGSHATFEVDSTGLDPGTYELAATIDGEEKNFENAEPTTATLTVTE